MEEHNKLDSGGLAVSFAATAGLMYIVTAVFALISPEFAGRVESAASTGLDVNAAFAIGTFIVGLIVAALVGLVGGALVAWTYNAYVESQYTMGEARHTRHASVTHH